MVKKSYTVGQTVIWNKEDIRPEKQPEWRIPSPKKLLLAAALTFTIGYLGQGYIHEKQPIRTAIHNIQERIHHNKETKRLTTDELDNLIRELPDNPKQNILLWDSTITATEQKYHIQQGLLAGLLMRESKGNPLDLNETNDGGAGIAMFQPGTARHWGLQVFGNSKRTGRDKRHGKELEQLVQQNDTTYSRLKNVDERFDVNKAIDASARFLTYNKERFGTWSKAISAYNAGSPKQKYMDDKHNHMIREYQRIYLEEKKKQGVPVDEQLLKELKELTLYKFQEKRKNKKYLYYVCHKDTKKGIIERFNQIYHANLTPENIIDSTGKEPSTLIVGNPIYIRK
ncbi:MAG: transglycosylase SLT domain-containing protein [Nanoarchaeota archaeon]|nr:transglycosylase SLT domain-containing protein [Nanoarchaeota archaeon]